MVQSYMQRQDENISAADRYQHAMALSLVSDGRSKVVGVQDWGLLSLGMRGQPAETDSESLTRLDAFNKAKEQELRDTIFIIDVRIIPGRPALTPSHLQPAALCLLLLEVMESFRHKLLLT
jgi:hypothetical protein